jgi:hypothetical protein
VVTLVAGREQLAPCDFPGAFAQRLDAFDCAVDRLLPLLVFRDNPSDRATPSEQCGRSVM